MSGIDAFLRGFGEEPGYLDYGRLGPLSEVVQDELRLQVDLLGRARYGAVESFLGQDERMRTAVASLVGTQARIVVEDRPFERAQVGREVEAELLAQQPADVVREVAALSALELLDPLLQPGTERGQLHRVATADRGALRVRPATRARDAVLVLLRVGGIRRDLGDQGRHRHHLPRGLERTQHQG